MHKQTFVRDELVRIGVEQVEQQQTTRLEMIGNRPQRVALCLTRG